MRGIDLTPDEAGQLAACRSLEGEGDQSEDEEADAKIADNGREVGPELGVHGDKDDADDESDPADLDGAVPQPEPRLTVPWRPQHPSRLIAVRHRLAAPLSARTWLCPECSRRREQVKQFGATLGRQDQDGPVAAHIINGPCFS